MFKEKISQEAIKKMQNDPEMIRNICILAHVDHGKTTLSDSLISNNQIINQKLAGKLKYMDSREDEQIRQITMKASSITLFHQKVQRLTKEQKEAGVEPNQQLYKINLMDSPGHVDFTNEVSSALRLSDGALVLIDVVEGISPQSLTVLRQAWDEKIRTCLVLNKIDRLILERSMEADDIFQHCQNIIEQVNAVISSFINETNMQKYIKNTGTTGSGDSSDDEENEDEVLDNESKFFYAPEKGNVAFASSIDWWGFTVPSFARILAKKLGFRPKVLSKYLWGNFYFSNKKINKKPPTKNSKPMFVQFVMEPIVAEYKKEYAEFESMDSSDLSKARANLSATLRKRIPIDTCMFNMVVNRLPSPKQHQKERLEIFCPMLAELPANISEKSINDTEEEYMMYSKIKKGIEDWDNSDDAPIVIYISKMQPVDTKAYGQAIKQDSDSKESKRLIGFGRVFSGKIKKGAEMYVFGVTHSKERKDVSKHVIDDIFIFMGGNNLKAVTDMGAGNIVGIGGLDEALLKMGTISSLPECPSFAPARLLGTGLIKVAIQPKNLVEMPILIEGLKKLDKADPSASYYINDKGEYILETWGQIHLERCVKDLNDDFAQIEIEISEPIISFKETIKMTNLRRESDFEKPEKEQEWFEIDEVKAEKEKRDIIKDSLKKTGNKGRRRDDSSEEDEEKEKEEETKVTQDTEKLDQTDIYIERVMAMKNQKIRSDYKKIVDINRKMQGWAIGETANKKCRSRIRVVGLPFSMTKWLEKSQSDIALLNHLVSTWSKKNAASTIADEIKIAEKFLIDLEQQCVDHQLSNKLVGLIKRYLVCFGPKRCGTNLLINQLIDEKDSLYSKFNALKNKFLSNEQEPTEENKDSQIAAEEEKTQENGSHHGKSDIDTQATENKPESVELNHEKDKEEAKDEKKIKLNYYEKKRLRKRRKLEATQRWFKVDEKEVHSAITAGFELAVVNGPLLGEVILGAWFIIDEIEVIDPAAKKFLIKQKEEFEGIPKTSEIKSPQKNDDEEVKEASLENKNAEQVLEKEDDLSAGCYSDTYGPITGQIMANIQKLCRKAFLYADPRIVEGMYKWELQVSSENLGKIYAVIGKHRCKTLEEELQENSELFMLKILVPVYESFSFSDQIRDRECGIPHPQLVFYGWEINDMDPFHISLTEDEIEEFGDQELPSNQVKQIIDKIRKRKGLPIEKKLVADGSKQNTLSRKK